MTPRERILAAIAHRQPDAVPVDLGATPSSGISALAYGRLKKHLGIAGGHTRIYDVVQQLAQPEDVILDRCGIDVVDLGRTFNTHAADWYDIRLADGSGAQYPVWFRPQPTPDGGWKAYAPDGTEVAVMLQDMPFFDQSCFPYLDSYPADYRALPAAMGKVLWAALAHSPWDHAGAADFWAQLRARTLALRQQTDRAIMVVCGCNLFEWGTFLRRMDNFLMDLVAEPAQVERLLDALLEQHLQTLERVCRAVGDVADIVRFGDDLGTVGGPFMSAKTYRQLFKPRHKILCDFVKKNSRMHTFLHSCGSIHALLPDLIEAGIEVINPVQTNCRHMEPERLKRDFGKDITFWGGGCDTRSVLNQATPQAVKDHVQQRLEIFAEGGGFVFNTVHNILGDVPPENIVAMYEGIAEFNRD
jgi:uroporphyrinogen decarboxylase